MWVSRSVKVNSKLMSHLVIRKTGIRFISNVPFKKSKKISDVDIS